MRSVIVFIFLLLASVASGNYLNDVVKGDFIDIGKTSGYDQIETPKVKISVEPNYSLVDNIIHKEDRTLDLDRCFLGSYGKESCLKHETVCDNHIKYIDSNVITHTGSVIDYKTTQVPNSKIHFCKRYADHNGRATASWSCVTGGTALKNDFTGDVNDDDDLDYKITIDGIPNSKIHFCKRYADYNGRATASWSCVTGGTALKNDFTGDVDDKDDLDYMIFFGNKIISSTTGSNISVYNNDSFKFSGDVINLDNLNVSTANNAKTTVSFWMYWDGTNSVMPFGWSIYDFGWSIYDLWIVDNHFGFNTGMNDIYGISSSGLANSWHYITAVFTNGDVHSNELYVDGVKQSLSQLQGNLNNTNSYVSSSARIGGWIYTGHIDSERYRFRGKIKKLKIYNGSLTDSEVSSLYANSDTVINSNTLVAYFKLDGTSYNATTQIIEDKNSNHTDYLEINTSDMISYNYYSYQCPSGYDIVDRGRSFCSKIDTDHNADNSYDLSKPCNSATPSTKNCYYSWNTCPIDASAKCVYKGKQYSMFIPLKKFTFENSYYKKWEYGRRRGWDCTTFNKMLPNFKNTMLNNAITYNCKYGIREIDATEKGKICFTDMQNYRDCINYQDSSGCNLTGKLKSTDNEPIRGVEVSSDRKKLIMVGSTSELKLAASNNEANLIKSECQMNGKIGFEDVGLGTISVKSDKNRLTFWNSYDSDMIGFLDFVPKININSLEKYSSVVGMGRVLYSNNFNSSTDGWSDSKIKDFGGKVGSVLGRLTGVTEKTFDFGTANAGKDIEISFKMYKLDSWDNEHFETWINGRKEIDDVYNGWRLNSGDVDMGDFSVPSNGGHQGMTNKDSYHIYHIDTKLDTSGKVTVKFNSTLNQDIQDESYAIDDFKITEIDNTNKEMNSCSDMETCLILTSANNTPVYKLKDDKNMSFDGNTHFTFSLFLKPNSFKNGVIAASSQGLFAITMNSSGQVTASVKDANNNIKKLTVNAPLVVKRWNYITVSFDAGIFYLMVNQNNTSLNMTTHLASNIGVNEVYIGSNKSGGGKIDGYIGNIHIDGIKSEKIPLHNIKALQDMDIKEYVPAQSSDIKAIMDENFSALYVKNGNTYMVSNDKITSQECLKRISGTSFGLAVAGIGDYGRAVDYAKVDTIIHNYCRDVDLDSCVKNSSSDDCNTTQALFLKSPPYAANFWEQQGKCFSVSGASKNLCVGSDQAGIADVEKNGCPSGKEKIKCYYKDISKAGYDISSIARDILNACDEQRLIRGLSHESIKYQYKNSGDKLYCVVKSADVKPFSYYGLDFITKPVDNKSSHVDKFVCSDLGCTSNHECGVAKCADGTQGNIGLETGFAGCSSQECDYSKLFAKQCGSYSGCKSSPDIVQESINMLASQSKRVDIETGGFDLSISKKKHTIKIDNKVVKDLSRSWNIVVLDKNNTVVKTATFDVFGDANNATRFKRYLKGLPDKTKVIIATFNEPSRNFVDNDKLIDMLVSYGATKHILENLDYRSAYVLVGIKNERTPILEKYTDRYSSGIVASVTLENVENKSKCYKISCKSGSTFDEESKLCVKTGCDDKSILKGGKCISTVVK